MRDGERQVAPTLDGIRRDHVARYQFAANALTPKSRVIDFACGVGYGTKMLSDAGHTATGYDIDNEALAYAKQHYQGAGLVPAFKAMDGNAPGELGEADAGVCFETIEHIEDPRPLLLALRKAAPLLIASVPNEAVMPYEPEPGKVYAYHFRHYTTKQFLDLLAECGWLGTGMFGQAGPESEVERLMAYDECRSRTIIAVAKRVDMPERTPAPIAGEKSGKHLAILGLGPSVDQYVDVVKRQGGRHQFCDEVWVINALGNVFDCDLVFHMDDIRIQEIRAEARPASNIAAMVKWIKTSKVPVVTSRAHPGYPALVEYPLEDVLNDLGYEYFNNTAAYAIAMAIHTRRFSEISPFGMDFTYQNVHQAEKGRACVEFWLGQAHARGIKIHLPDRTTLLDACHTRAERLYGYDTLDVSFNIEADGKLTLGFAPRAKLPTAEEIERAYDHSVPIAKQHLEKGSSNVA